MNEAARISAELTLKALSCLQESISGEEDKEKILELLMNKDSRGMMKEAQDRAHGTPRQTVDSNHGLSDPLADLLSAVASSGKRIGS